MKTCICFLSVVTITLSLLISPATAQTISTDNPTHIQSIESSATSDVPDASKAETVTIQHLNVIGILNVKHNIIVENLEINTAGTLNFANGATLTVNDNISNEFRIGVIAYQPIILRSGIKIH